MNARPAACSVCSGSSTSLLLFAHHRFITEPPYLPQHGSKLAFLSIPQTDRGFRHSIWLHRTYAACCEGTPACKYKQESRQAAGAQLRATSLPFVGGVIYLHDLSVPAQHGLFLVVYVTSIAVLKERTSPTVRTSPRPRLGIDLFGSSVCARAALGIRMPSQTHVQLRTGGDTRGIGQAACGPYPSSAE